MQPKGSGFLPHLHAFRGFAIVNIVAVHAYAFVIFPFGTPAIGSDLAIVSAINETLFHASTIYFALISGLLFSAILAPRGWKSFFRGKLRNVVSPYLAMTLLFTVVAWFAAPRPTMPDGGAVPFWGFLLYNAITGNAMFTYWYIPVLLILFLATPGVAWIQRQTWSHWGLLALALAPLVLSRTWPNEGPTTWFYFLGAYTVGLVFGADPERWFERLARWTPTLWIVTLLTSAALIVLFLWEFEWIGPVSVRESVFYVQKLAISGLVLQAFHRRRESLPRLLAVFADYAFAIFFIHGLFMYMAWGSVLQAYPGGLGVGHTLAFGTVNLAVGLFLSLGIAMGLKRILGRRSRLIIGA